jgi:hypothetical protein
MKGHVTLAALLVIAQAATGVAATATGSAAFALASLVARNSPMLSADDKRVIARLFEGDSSVALPADKKILVTADSIVCRVSNVDLTARRCELEFGATKLVLSGREANEINTTLAAVGATPEGAAGSMIESISKLVCTIDFNGMNQRAGGGARCTFDAAR